MSLMFNHPEECKIVFVKKSLYDAIENLRNHSNSDETPNEPISPEPEPTEKEQHIIRKQLPYYHSRRRF